MKLFKNIKKTDIVFILLATLLFLLPLLYNSMSEGHDLRFHLYRLVGIVDGLKDHQLPVRVYPIANNDFGYGTPLFYCDYFLYPFALLYGFLNIPLIKTFKIMLVFI